VTTYVAANDGTTTTLSFASGEFTEYFTSGMKFVYAKHKASGNRYEIDRILDSSGNTHSYTYGTSGGWPLWVKNVWLQTRMGAVTNRVQREGKRSHTPNFAQTCLVPACGLIALRSTGG
jgi:hypothetical protein